VAGLSDESGTTNSERDFSADEKGDGDATQIPCAVTKGQAKEKSSNTGGCCPVSELARHPL